MTIHQTNAEPAQVVAPVSKTVSDADALAAPLRALPVAPLAMPKQVLTPEPGILRRRLAQTLARLGMAKPGVRRAS